MIDIHPPHHAAMTRREILTHLAIVVLGILIAIGLEQSVEYLHHRHLAAEATRALLAERNSDELCNEFNIFATKRHQRDLQHGLAVLHALRTHTPVPPGPFIIRHPTYHYPDDEWQKIHQSGTINYLTGNLGAIAYRYSNQAAFLERVNRSTEDLARAGSVLRSPTDPLNRTFEENVAFSDFLKRFTSAHESLPAQEVEAEWATLAERGNVAALSPDQIDSLARALQIALADDDALLASCYNIKRNLANNPVR